MNTERRMIIRLSASWIARWHRKLDNTTVCYVGYENNETVTYNETSERVHLLPLALSRCGGR